MPFSDIIAMAHVGATLLVGFAQVAVVLKGIRAMMAANNDRAVAAKEDTRIADQRHAEAMAAHAEVMAAIARQAEGPTTNATPKRWPRSTNATPKRWPRSTHSGRYPRRRAKRSRP